MELVMACHMMADVEASFAGSDSAGRRPCRFLVGLLAQLLLSCFHAFGSKNAVNGSWSEIL